MKFLISIILIALLSFAVCLYLPWWSIAIITFLVMLFIPMHPGKAFLSGFTALFLLWGGLAFWLSFENDHILAQKMSMVILKTGNAYLLVIVTALIGGITAGLAALSASLVVYKKTELA